MEKWALWAHYKCGETRNAAATPGMSLVFENSLFCDNNYDDKAFVRITLLFEGMNAWMDSHAIYFTISFVIYCFTFYRRILGQSSRRYP